MISTPFTMKKLFLNTSRAFVFAFLLQSLGCDIKDNDVEANESFLKVYDNSLFDGSYIPLDVQQTSDEGFMILSGTRIKESNFVGIKVLKADAEGNFVSQTDLEANLVHPVYNLIKADAGYFFVCMDAISLQAQLVQLDEAGGLLGIVPLSGIYYPLHVTNLTGDQLILQSYDIENKQTVLSLLRMDGTTVKTKAFKIGAGDEVEKPIIEHFTRTGKQLPFLSGQAYNGKYYFNGFYNYTFSLVFTDLNADDPSGVAQGQQDDGGISALLPLEESTFAMSRFNFGDNYILPNTEINTTGVSSSIDMTGFSMPELKEDAKVILERVTVNGQKILIYGSDTKNGQIALIAYDELSGELKGTKYLGFAFPYEIAGFVQTADEGLAVAALTQVAGRFPRICLFKLSKEELAEFSN